MINTAWISLTNGQKLSEIWDYMVKAAALAPNNPESFW
jgi:hypothetical protein